MRAVSILVSAFSAMLCLWLAGLTLGEGHPLAALLIFGCVAANVAVGFGSWRTGAR